MNSASKPSAPQGRSLFGEPERPTAHVAYIDGASRGNPGAAAYAVVVKAPGGKTEFEIGKYFGRATNNVAEYYGLIAALDAAQSHGIKRLLIRSDSELLVRQMQGRYKVKSPDLKPLFEHAQKLARGFAHFAIEHVPREQNSDADALANRALDETSRSGTSRSSNAAPIAVPHEQPKEPRPVAAPRADAAANNVPVTRAATVAIRARYSAGALHPLEALDLDEGEIVDLSIKKSSRA